MERPAWGALPHVDQPPSMHTASSKGTALMGPGCTLPPPLNTAGITDAPAHSNGASTSNSSSSQVTSAVVPLAVPAAAPAPTHQAAAPAPAPVPPPVLPPAGVYQNFANAGGVAAGYSPAKTLVLGLYAGMYIALGGFLGSAVVSGCPGVCVCWGGGGQRHAATLRASMRTLQSHAAAVPQRGQPWNGQDPVTPSPSPPASSTAQCTCTELRACLVS